MVLIWNVYNLKRIFCFASNCICICFQANKNDYICTLVVNIIIYVIVSIFRNNYTDNGLKSGSLPKLGFSHTTNAKVLNEDKFCCNATDRCIFLLKIHNTTYNVLVVCRKGKGVMDLVRVWNICPYYCPQTMGKLAKWLKINVSYPQIMCFWYTS